MPRDVTLVLHDVDGSLVGALDPFTVELPWWSEVESVVEAAQRARGADVAVLRLLHARADPTDRFEMGGAVTYAAELRGPRPAGLHVAEPVDIETALADEPLRLPWARPGGPARALEWATARLAEHGRTLVARPRQMRTWNLSSIWSLPTAAGRTWLKCVPPFFAHEGAMIEWLGFLDAEYRAVLPPVLARAAGRVLMAEISGVDLYDASNPILERAVATLVAMQERAAGRVDDLLALGLPDWRWPALRGLIADVVERHRHELERPEQRALDELLAGLDERCAAIDECGLPVTFVHGDFHPGNLRGDLSENDTDGPVLLDWGDCGVGHPLLDVPAMVANLTPQRSAALAQRWVREWTGRCPGSDPERAANLIGPVAALRQAVIYRGFLDRIEPTERCYHAADPGRWLLRAARLTGSG